MNPLGRIHDLIEASSLGTPAAKAARESVRIVVEPTDHRIVFDHGPCFHHEDPDAHNCSAEASITCEADDTEVGCRFGCDRCETYGECDDCVPGEAHEGHNPEERHCDYGHPMRPLDECQAILFVEDEGVTDAYAGPEWPHIWPDGPIVVEWTGDGYTWHYPSTAHYPDGAS